ncbi:MAG: caspase family protein, partial [Rhodocyclaceae bacterium]
MGLISWTGAQPGIAAHESIGPVRNGDPGVSDADARRIALVIGNTDYRRGKLENPTNDAQAMDAALTRLGFDVVTYVNLTEREMSLAIREFGRRLESGGVGLFYFAGHGLRVGGRTFLAPIDVDSESPAQLLIKGVDLQSLLDAMSRPRPGKINIAILDTCLSSPFGGVTNDAPALPDETLVAYSTAPGALSGDGFALGLYTESLLGSLAVSSADIREVLERASAVVSQDSGRRQVPWVASTLSGGVSLGTLQPAEALPVVVSPRIRPAVAMRTRGVLPKDSAEQYELAFWESIKNSNYAKEYEAYLAAYPNGRFSGLARARLERLRGNATKSVPAVEPARPAAVRPAAPERPPRAPAVQQVQEPPVPARPASAAPEPAAAKGAVAGAEIKDCPTCPVMIPLRPATFTMGSNTDDPSEKPAHAVTLTRPFA